MGLVQIHEFMRTNTKSSTFFLMLKSSYTKSGVGLFEFGFIGPGLDHICPGLGPCPGHAFFTAWMKPMFHACSARL